MAGFSVGSGLRHDRVTRGIDELLDTSLSSSTETEIGKSESNKELTVLLNQTADVESELSGSVAESQSSDTDSVTSSSDSSATRSGKVTPDSYFLLTKRLQKQVIELLDLDVKERSVKVSGRNRFEAPLKVLKESFNNLRKDQVKTRLAIIEALRAYPKQRKSQEAAAAIGKIFGSEIKRISSEHPYNQSEVAAESLANIHAYPKGPIGVTNARIFEDQLQTCLLQNSVDLLSSDDLLADRVSAQNMRVKLMESRSDSSKNQEIVINEVTEEFLNRLEALKQSSKQGGFEADRDTITWQGCIRGSKDDPMGHAYIVTFHVKGEGESARVFMKVSDSGELGKGFMKQDDGKMLPRIYELDRDKEDDLKSLIREMAESTVYRDQSLSNRTQALRNKIAAVKVTRPDLPRDISLLRENTMRKLQGNYCVSWSHMHNMQSRYSLKTNAMLNSEKAAKIVSDLSMIMYRHNVDMALLKEAGHAASRPLRTIVSSAQGAMAEEADSLLKEWASLSDEQKGSTDTAYDEPVSNILKEATEFVRLNKTHVVRIESGNLHLENQFTVKREVEAGAIFESETPAPRQGSGAAFKSYIYPPTPPSIDDTSSDAGS